MLYIMHDKFIILTLVDSFYSINNYILLYKV